MNVITLLTIIVIGWLIYSLIQSHHNIEKELREIRMKCVLPNNTSPSSNKDQYSNTDNYPLNSLKTSLVSNLTSLLPNK